jgi:hypothetical protein
MCLAVFIAGSQPYVPRLGANNLLYSAQWWPPPLTTFFSFQSSTCGGHPRKQLNWPPDCPIFALLLVGRWRLPKETAELVASSCSNQGTEATQKGAETRTGGLTGVGCPVSQYHIMVRVHRQPSPELIKTCLSCCSRTGLCPQHFISTDKKRSSLLWKHLSRFTSANPAAHNV